MPRVGLAVCFAVVMLGCGARPDTGSDAGVEGTGAGGGGGAGGGNATSDVRIVTETLASGRIGLAYAQPLSASGGSSPYGWIIVSKSPAFAWLTINSTSGLLSGVPGASATGSVMIAVTDQNASTVTKEFFLHIDACQSGTSVGCVVAESGACKVGMQACVDGQLAGTCAGTLSTDLMRCGAACGACDAVAADRCSSGVCACGSGAACGAGETCCGGTCKSLDDVRSCGSCSNDCTAVAGQENVTATCSSRQCAFACSASNFQHCVGNTSVPPTPGVSCETNVSVDEGNCGSCGHSCAPVQNASTVASAPCASGQCLVTCVAQNLNCNGASEDGCEVPFSTNNCGSCGNVCQAGANVNVACTSGSCSFSCQGSRIHCVNGVAAPLGNNVACETDPMTDRNNCGGCGTQCAADQVCSSGVCVCSQALCGAGRTCLPSTNRCGCTPATCPSGCCTVQGTGGVCSPGTTNSLCGGGGATCTRCLATCPTCKLIVRPTGDICTCGEPYTRPSTCEFQACSCDGAC